MKILVQSLHTVALTRLDRGIHLCNLAFANQVTDSRCAYHDFMCGNPAAARALQQRLRDNGSQRLGQHGAHHFFLAGREHVDNSIDGLGRGAGMQGAEDEVAGFGRCQSEPDCFEVAQLADAAGYEYRGDRLAAALPDESRRLPKLSLPMLLKQLF